MKTGRKSLLITCFVIIALLLTTSAYATPSTTVSIADVTMEPGSNITLPINIVNIEDYGTGTINLAYDPAVVHVTDVTGSSDSTVIVKNINNTIGFAMISAWNLSGVSGDIVFANVTFEAVAGTGNSTPLNLTVDTLQNITYDEIPNVEISNGTVTTSTVPILTITLPEEGQVVKSSMIEWQSTGDLTDANHTILKLDSNINICYLPLSGNYTFQTDDGYHNVQAWLAYANNTPLTNPESHTIVNFTLDTVTTITIDPVTTPTNVSSQTVTGTMENGATVEVTCTNATVGSVTNTTDTWSVEITNMSEGENVITATAADQAGNTALATETIVLDTDTTVTIDPVTTPTNANAQTVTGTMENGATVEVTCSSDATVGTVNDLTATTWSVEITDMSEGENVITTTAADPAGNTASDSATIMVDLTPPTISIDDVTSPTNVNAQTVSGTMENGATVEVTCSSDATVSTVTLTDTTWSVEITGMSEGENVITASSTDQVGNTASATETIVLDIDTTITIDPVTTPTNVNSQTVTGTMENGATVEVTCSSDATVGTVNNPTDTTWSVEITGMSEGENVITATATDQTGNTASDTATIVLDTTAPIVTMYSPPAITNDSTPLLYATFDEIVASTWYVIDGAAGTGDLNTDNLTVTLPELADGQHSVTVKASDSVGNVGNATQNFLVDTIEPELILELINEGNVSTLYINSSEPLSNCTVDNEKCTNSSSKNWSRTLEDNGTYLIVGTDLAGNEALRNLTLEIGIISETDNYNRTNYSTGNVTINITTSQHVNESNITICEYDKNPVGSLNATTVSLLGINKFVQMEIDPALNDNISKVIIYVDYSGADLTGIDEDSLRLHVWNDSINKWEELIPGGVDKENQRVWAELDHFSLFGILGEQILDDGGNGDNGNSGGNSGGRGRVAGSSGESYENIAVKEAIRQYVAKDTTITYQFKEDANSIEFIRHYAKATAGYKTATIEVLKSTSTLVSTAPHGEVYQNMNIWVGNRGYATERNIANSVVRFKVARSWISANNIDESTIRLNRYSDENWNSLATSQVDNDADYLYFESVTLVFSSFAITAEKNTAEAGGEGIVPEPTNDVEMGESIPEQISSEEKRDIPGFSLFAGLSVSLIAVQLLRKKK